MGLDIADYVMDVEDEFGIEIREGMGIDTVGALHEYVVTELQHKGQVISPEDAWTKLVEITARHTKYPIRRESRFGRDLGMD